MKLLAADNNAKGDLFGRLAGDVFLALGYENPRFNIHKTGREIDVKAGHRLEPKYAIAECKAVATPVGGADLNKFAGALQAERESLDCEVQGYFVSLSGFTESAVEQELAFAEQRFVLLNGEGVQNQLIAGGMVVSSAIACEVAGRLAASCPKPVALVDPPELIAHDLGWIWLCRFEQDHEVTHYALVHADGRPLSPSLAESAVEQDEDLLGLVYLRPDEQVGANTLAEADGLYREYLLAELGEITLEGLPADEDVGAKRIALEDLYVPVGLSNFRQKSQEGEVGQSALTEIPETGSPDGDGDAPDVDDDSESIGSVLRRDPRIAILAPPGAGKSTLIKRLAVAYASDRHRELITDDLPDSRWLPLFIRCRALDSSRRESIRQIIEGIPSRGEFPQCETGFKELVNEALSSGTALLLIDGLDEISDDGDRVAFIQQLRTFLAIYPQLAVVLTSREAGFRAVGGAISSICEWYRLAEFDDDDIVQLTRSWHETVVGKSLQIDQDARDLALTIIGTDRVRKLARNPLLLTTLLLVKRWVGDLPRKRSILYEKAIEVLLMTWNVAAHEPIDREEAIPQLAFVAHSLTRQGVQSLSATRLGELLTMARRQMPEVLGFARISVVEFVDRVESRSSLMVMTGHVEEDGKLVPLYEFRHLTFQEYLTAVALVEGYYEGHKEGDSLAHLLKPRIEDPGWYEVIALANVQAGRYAKDIVQMMLGEADAAQSGDLWGEGDVPQVFALLGRCLADEVQLSPTLVTRIASTFGRAPIRTAREFELVAEVLAGRYGDAYTTIVEDSYLTKSDDYLAFLGSFEEIVRIKLKLSDKDIDDSKFVEWITRILAGDDEGEAAKAAVCAMKIAFGGGRRSPLNASGQEENAEALMDWSSSLISWCETGKDYLRYMATWALAWLGDRGMVRADDRARGLRVLLEIWRDGDSERLRKQAAWAFAAMPEVEREQMPLGEGDDGLYAFVEREAATEAFEGRREDQVPAAITLAYYLGKPWSDEKIAIAANGYRQSWGTLLGRIAKAP